MLKYENDLWGNGINLICGVDEVGRGSFAGPLVTSAVVWDKDFITENWKDKNSPLHQINDSKKLTPKKRDELSGFIKENCKILSIVEISNTKIDEIGVGEANKLAIIKAINKLGKDLEVALIDHFELRYSDVKIKTISITKGDFLSLSIASASIIAKVYRDKLMKKYHDEYPVYGFDTNVGYGTKKHRDAIKTHGLSPLHRNSFHIK